MSRTLILPLVSLTLLTFAMGCGDDSSRSDNNGAGGSATGGGSNSGGESSGTGAAAATGGNSGTGASAATGGGSATGGGGNTPAFTCPSGLSGMTPTVAGKTPTIAATAPDMGGEAQVFLEGPVWIGGSLYVSQIRKWGDQPPARIMKLNGGNLEEFIADTGTNGLALRGDGALVAASHKAFGLVAYDVAAPATAPVPVVSQYETKGFNSPNDLALRSDGNIYFTDPDYQCGNNCPQGKAQGEKRVYRVDPSGTVSVVASTHDEPNGIALSPDENTLYVAGSGAIEKFDVSADGSIGARNVFVNTSGVDGLGIDCAGNVYATVHSQSKVDVYTPAGTLHGSLSVGAAVTNVAFGGADNKTLYITTYDKQLYSVDLDIPGYPY